MRSATGPATTGACGPGTATWAAAEAFPSLQRFTLLDANDALRALALGQIVGGDHDDVVLAVALAANAICFTVPMLLAGGAVGAVVTDSFELTGWRGPPPGPVECAPPRDRKVYWIAPARAARPGPPCAPPRDD